MILVAGGTGRLGTLLVERLSAAGFPVRVLTRDPGRAAHLARTAEVVTGDVRDRGTLGPAFEDVDVAVSAFHGFAGGRDSSPATVDRDGNINFIDAAGSAGADVVLLSLVGASADNQMELARMKFAAEQFARASKVPTTVVRCTAFMELWIELLRSTAAKSGRPLVFGRGENPINFVSVQDVAALVTQAVRDPATRGMVLEIGGPENLTFNQLAAAVQRADGRLGSPRHVPRAALWLMAETIGRLSPQVGRQTRSALVMDGKDLTFNGSIVLPEGADPTSVQQVLAGR